MVCEDRNLQTWEEGPLWSKWGMTGQCGSGAEEMARSGWVPGDQLAGKLNVCVISGVEDHPSSHQGPMLSLHLECCSTHSLSDSSSIPLTSSWTSLPPTAACASPSIAPIMRCPGG